MAHHDPTLSQHSLFGSISWVAMTLGLTKDSFKRKRDALEAEGFPARDALTNLFIKDDVYAWVNRRRKVADRVVAISERKKPKTEVNTDAL